MMWLESCGEDSLKMLGWSMPKTERFRCLNCGHRFEAEALTQEEKQEAKREDKPIFSINCPICYRTDVRRGWD
jgi:transposase-like protein